MNKDTRTEESAQTRIRRRDSNLELFRILSMLVIIAHHYVVNSGLSSLVYNSTTMGPYNVFLLLLGWGGKTGINCFVLITGYYLCLSRFRFGKFWRLFGEMEFYSIVIWLIFTAAGYEAFTLRNFLYLISPLMDVTDGFVYCFLLFYLATPFLGKMVTALSEREHLCLIGLCLFIYTFLPSLNIGITVNFNYFTWFIVLALIGSWLQRYPKEWFHKTVLWGSLTLANLALSWGSVLWMGYRALVLQTGESAYYYVADCNKIFALSTAVCAFLFFKNLRIPCSRGINTIASSMFGVLMIHANSDAMRQWLWQDLLKCPSFYESRLLPIHAALSILGVFTVCVIIDQVRIRVIEQPAERAYRRLADLVKTADRR